MTDQERIADLENQLETWKRLQKTNEATIRFWQEKHEQNQQCLILFTKRLNKVTAENVELKRMLYESNVNLFYLLFQKVKDSKVDEECAEAIEMFKALNE